ncbi:hypothetical protein [Legionella spiritensis]|uniref:Integral membrane protein (PIN domain superfamily) n=1 Tax=Legionella spiritensis TaxID=452 RepID=A0A0W0YYU0_LEGSP|nr:hypothetical protein [Legionella spiritensis]KTD62061.1 Integral membrane protein (PIN domain superfamily) [Legionella spiritensis]SNV34424.1 Integral membrane protein (PIN domain superfamily) [Legionella spiritensis]VEG89618.1 Integral membrane protein (PIN domain superfamily) [Legionella spiritensis]
MQESLLSLLMAQIFGFYFLIIAIVMITRPRYYSSILTNLKDCRVTAFAAATFSLFIGLLLVITHNIWVFESEVIITIVAWLILIQSILWLSIPEKMMVWSHWYYSGVRYYITAIIMGIIGILLLAHGFYLFI